MRFKEPLQGIAENSKVVILDFNEIPKCLPPEEDIQRFFEESMAAGVNPRLPENRQQFNDQMIAFTGMKYLIGRYREDRSAMLVGSEMYEQGRVIHLGVDIFAQGLEPILAPCDGEIVRTGYEKQAQGYGHYLIIKPTGINSLYIFLGHLGKDLHGLGTVQKDEKVGRLGDFKNNENGGWSRHLHLQMLTELPPEGETPIGYSSKQDIKLNSQRFPDPGGYFPNWIY